MAWAFWFRCWQVEVWRVFVSVDPRQIDYPSRVDIEHVFLSSESAL